MSKLSQSKNKKYEREANEIRMIFYYKKRKKSIGDIASEMGLTVATVMSYCRKYHIDATGYYLPSGAQIKSFDTRNRDGIGRIVDPDANIKGILESATQSVDNKITNSNIKDKEISPSEAPTYKDNSYSSISEFKETEARHFINSVDTKLTDYVMHETKYSKEDVLSDDTFYISEELDTKKMGSRDNGKSVEFNELPSDNLEYSSENNLKDILDNPICNNYNPQRFYLVDTENQGCAALKRILKIPDTARKFLLFYTNYSQHLDFQTIRLIAEQSSSMEFIECNYGIKNALDFQLVSYLGYLIHQYPDATFTIVSNDGGFDPAISFWKDRRIRVSRLGVKCVQQSSKFGQYNNRSNTQVYSCSDVESRFEQDYESQRMENLPYHPNECSSVENKNIIKNLELINKPIQNVAKPNMQQELVKKCITTQYQNPYESLRKVGSCCTKYTPKQYRRVTQIATSELRRLFKKHKIKSTKIAKLAEYILCHPDYTKFELVQLTDLETAEVIINRISQAEIKTMIVHAERRK